jgi:hypothetical protein
MAKAGFYWYTDPGVIGQKFSVFAEHLPFKLGTAVSSAIDEAAQEMRERVMGLPRIRTGAMYSSIGSELQTSGARVRANYGFIYDAPYYTAYQEYGTSRGIVAMHAFVDASQKLYSNLKAKIDVEDIWSDLR